MYSLRYGIVSITADYYTSTYLTVCIKLVVYKCDIPQNCLREKIDGNRSGNYFSASHFSGRGLTEFVTNQLCAVWLADAKWMAAPPQVFLFGIKPSGELQIVEWMFLYPYNKAVSTGSSGYIASLWAPSTVTISLDSSRLGVSVCDKLAILSSYSNC